MTLKVKLYCVEDGCEREVYNLARELCSRCYQRLWKQGKVRELGTCKHPKCNRVEGYGGVCTDHRHLYFPELFDQTFRYSKMLRGDRTRVDCSNEGCPREAIIKGLCSACDSYLSRREKGFTPKIRRYVQLDGSRLKCEASSVECEEGAVYNGMCRLHAQRVTKSGVDDKPINTEPCPVPGCGRPKVLKGVICKKCNQFRWRFSLTHAQVIDLYAPEKRICSNSGCFSDWRLHMDHDHSCCPPDKFTQSRKVSCGGCIRGWLCQACNTSLGLLQENPERIRGLLDFMENPPGILRGL